MSAFSNLKVPEEFFLLILYLKCLAFCFMFSKYWLSEYIEGVFLSSVSAFFQEWWFLELVVLPNLVEFDGRNEKYFDK